ncbi:MAG: AAA family ATPase [Proteobacteria bacterium]|nr:AAA family ATPase [Pseudomonadota bacterium]
MSLENNKFFDYDKNIEVINHIKFTPREIDIIACILCGRTAKKDIAFILSIQPRTAETHTRNIMHKIRCNGWGGIRDFIEKTGYSDLIRHHYTSLLLQKEFNHCLRQIFLLIKKEENILDLQFFSDIKNSDGLFFRILKDLRDMGINVHVREDKNSFDIHNYSVFFITAGTIKKICMLLQDPTFLSKNHIFILWDKSLILEDFPDLKNISYLDFKSQNYYFSFFYFLEKFISPSVVENIFFEFKREYKKFFNSSECAQFNFSSEEHIHKKKEISDNIYMDAVKNKKNYFMILFLCMIILSVFLFIFTQNNQKIKISPLSKKDLSMRSELIVPIESVFLKRYDLIKKMNEALKSQHKIRIIALVGMGGVGKTTIARYFGKTDQSSIVYELNAETKKNLINSFEELAYKIAKTPDKKKELEIIQKIQNIELKEKKLIYFVQEQLREHPNWLLIFDNVQTISNIKKNYLPQDSEIWGSGKIIITTRDSTIKNTNYIEPQNIIEIGELNKEESLMLFSKIFFNKESNKLTLDQREKCLEFLKNIPPFPLDISIAAYYIKNEQLTYDQYIHRINQYTKFFDKTQENLLKEISDSTKTRFGIITSSLEKFININPDFKELLLFIVLLDSQNIPKNLIALYKDEPSIEQLLYYLRKNGFITKVSSIENGEEAPLFSIHRSSQEIILASLKNILTEDERKRCLCQVIEAIKIYHKMYLKKNCRNIILLIPHIEKLQQNLNKILISSKDIELCKIETLIALGNSHRYCTQNCEAVRSYFLEILEIKDIKKKISSYTLLTIFADLGWASYILGLFDQAIFYCQESIKLCKRNLESEEMEAQNLLNTAISYYQKNEKESFEKSCSYYKKALSIALKIKDENLKNSFIVTIYNDLSFLYRTTYLHKKETLIGKKYVQKALDLLKSNELFHLTYKKLPEEKIKDILKARYAMGQVYCRLGQYEKALKEGCIEEQYIINFIESTGNKISLTIEKPLLAESFGESFLRLNRLEEAELQLTQAIKAFEDLWGPRVIAPRVYRAEIYIRKGQFKEAYEDCLVVFKTQRKSKNNYINLMFFINYYHAAIIKYKEKDFFQSSEYFRDFFKNIRVFCKMFLDKNQYKFLESEKVFEDITFDKNKAEKDIKDYLKRSVKIFSEIYGPSHSFITDYVTKN